MGYGLWAMGYWPNINPMTIIVIGEVMNEEFVRLNE
jgi:hypothetical protein